MLGVSIIVEACASLMSPFGVVMRWCSQVLEVQAGYLSNAKNLSMIVTRNGSNFTCPLVMKAANGVEWLPVPDSEAVAMLVTPVVVKAQNESLEAVGAPQGLYLLLSCAVSCSYVVAGATQLCC